MSITKGKKALSLAVVGCGKLGFPIAVQAASQGYNVIGVDVNSAIVKSINLGKSPINEPGVQVLLSKAIKSGRIRATDNLESAVKQADAIIVIVPVVLTSSKEADLETIINVTKDIADAMRLGTVVSFETTLPVGTTRNVLLPILQKNGLKVEKDFYLVFSPERMKSLSIMKQIKKIPKIIGGAGPLSLKKGIELYKSIFPSEIIGVDTLENAEMVKLAGMVYRDVNIALVNELVRYCDKIGINFNKLIPFVNTDGEANLLRPGIGVGGHCTPVYPYFLINDANRRGVSQALAESARKINDTQAEYLIQYLDKLLGDIKNRKILILGLSFRPDIKEDIYSSAYLIQNALRKRGAIILLYDPLYSEEEINEKGFIYTDFNKKDDTIDAVVLNTAHSSFSKINWKKLKEKGVKIFIDGRNYYKSNEIENCGIKYIGIGTADIRGHIQ